MKTAVTYAFALGMGVSCSTLPGSPLRGPIESNRLCPALDTAPTPIVATPTDGEGQCAVEGNVAAAFPQSDTIEEEALVKLRGAIEQAVADNPRACVAVLGRQLAKTTDCGIVYDAVAIRILNGKSVDPRLAAGELLRPSKCQWKLVSALREAERANLPTIAAVVKLTQSSDEDVRNSAWLTLGSLERIAKTAGQPDLAGCMDRVIGGELTRRPVDKRKVLLNAAGNAACESCRSVIEKGIESPDNDYRRTATSALRFMQDSGAVDAMCRVLRQDVDPKIRQSAAFSLRHETSHLETRLQCLVDAASSDSTESVAKDAINSIGELAEHAEDAVGALVIVFKQSENIDVRKHAVQVLRRFAKDDSIKEVLQLE